MATKPQVNLTNDTTDQSLLTQTDLRETVIEEETKEKMFMKLSLYPEVTEVNVLTLFLGSYSNRVVMSFALSFIPMLLINHYHVPQTEAGKVAGNLGFYAALTNLALELVMGSILDALGRKWVTAVGFLVTGTALCFMPLFDFTVFPYLYILRILVGVGAMPMINSPLYLDYIQHKTMAVTGSYISLIGTAANLTSISGSSVLSTQVSVGIIFIGFGVFAFLVGVTMLFGIQEVASKHAKKQADEMTKS